MPYRRNRDGRDAVPSFRPAPRRLRRPLGYPTYLETYVMFATLYNVVVRNDRDNTDERMNAAPMTHDEAVTFRSKLIPDAERPKHLRSLLVAVNVPRCDMERDCSDPVTHIDHKGYVYCETHGRQRKAGGIRCRALKPAELRLLEQGQPVARY